MKNFTTTLSRNDRRQIAALLSQNTLAITVARLEAAGFPDAADYAKKLGAIWGKKDSYIPRHIIKIVNSDN